MRTPTRSGLIILTVLLFTVTFVMLVSQPEPALFAQTRPASLGAQQEDMPRFTSDGQLMRPVDWEAWVMVGASLGLTYTESGNAPVPGAGPGIFHTIFLQPWAYRSFLETGEFAENTMFILSLAEASQHADPARGGAYEGERVLSEVHLKRQGQHESGWGFYAFGNAESAPMIPGEASCYSCHAEQAAYDHVFVQFYPPLRRVTSSN